MSRADSHGMFWNDVERVSTRGQKSVAVRSVEVPRTDWQQQHDFPNLSGVKLLGLDIESKDLQLRDKGPGFIRGDAYIAGVSVAAEDRAWYFPMRHAYDPQRSLNHEPSRVLAWLQGVLDTTTSIVGANILYDLEGLRSEGVTVPKHVKLYDVQYAEPLLDENMGSYALDVLAQKHLGRGKETPLLYKWCAESFGGSATAKDQAENIWRAPPTLVGPYAEADALLPVQILQKQMQLLEADALTKIFAMECGLIPLLLNMRFRGVRVAESRAIEAAAWLREEARKAQDNLDGVDVWSGQSIERAFKKAGYEIQYTAAGNASFTRPILEAYDNDLSRAILEVRLYEKAANPFIESYLLGNMINGRVHCQFNPLRSDDFGTVSGRFCVHGDTRIPTNRGEFAIKDYQPKIGDTVLSHLGRPCRVLRRIYKGREAMLRVELANGSAVTGTANHRIMTNRGWTSLGDLNVTDHAATYARNSALPEQGKTNDQSGSKAFQDSFEHCNRDNQQRDSRETVQVRKEPSIFTQQNGEKESHAIQARRVTSRLQRRSEHGIRRVFADKGKQQIYAGASCEFFEGFGTEKNSQRLCGSSHRRRSAPQRNIKPVSTNNCSARNPACLDAFSYSKVTSIIVMGSSDVWDLEIEDDHSYCAQGMVHHNSSSHPNLQNIPSRHPVLGPFIRSLYIPDDDCDWVKGDYAQIEYRLFANDAVGEGSDELRRRYNEEADIDFHQMTIDLVHEITGIRLDRKPAKNINFGFLYGMGKDKTKRSLGVSADMGERLYDAYFKAIPSAKATSQSAQRLANRRGYIKTLLGRRRRFPTIKEGKYGEERAGVHAALNARLQGGSADIIKKGMLMCHEAGLFEDDALRLHLTVHDELDMSVARTKRAKEALAEAKRIMETCVKIKVPLIFELSTGPNWGACE